MGRIFSQAVDEGQGGRNQAIFAEFPLTNRDDTLIQIDISNPVVSALLGHETHIRTGAGKLPA
jgi:hypothetical protein